MVIIMCLLSASNRPTNRYSGFSEHVEHPLIIINHPSLLYLPSLLILMPVIMDNILFLDSHCYSNSATCQLTVSQVCFSTSDWIKILMSTSLSVSVSNDRKHQWAPFFMYLVNLSGYRNTCVCVLYRDREYDQPTLAQQMRGTASLAPSKVDP